MSLHHIQTKLLQLSATHNLDKLSLRDIGSLIAEDQAQTVKYHLEQLEKGGYITWDRVNKIITRVPIGEANDSHLFAIPVLGAADCGPETLYADENIESYLKVSGRIISPKKSLFALRAVGLSMNKADIGGESIADGDYVIVDSELRNPQSGDYVVSVIDGLCNIKKYSEDKDKQQITLLSESTENFPPIVIHPEEKQFLINGEVIKVIKNQA